ncbi:hypothetical protein [Corynebacterium glucuronolyticum]|uniref:hypothetical protein n=1 Tax=Corynebacterium glucuronolyticum TaxID=39791 RepID=UPI00223B65B3|nr:hypothetical protein [Corynebacterium glucuronolyticum]MCT1442952.1 hypothetical protein [Corynebacterium glucuronolyticum]
METINIYSFSNHIDPDDEDAMEQLATQIRIERHVPEIEELGIPRFRITNGPVGVGMGDGTPSPPATALLMTIGVAASFVQETDDLGQQVLEGPGLCLHRTVTAGRNFEYFSEDPHLTGIMGVEAPRRSSRTTSSRWPSTSWSTIRRCAKCTCCCSRWW